ncbi:MAG TPA: glycosyltransferase family 4 protein [Dehalococcoidia bacterium]|nr:glycosyltransferase family 4 protein [Dehalococcoidia bacterium]
MKRACLVRLGYFPREEHLRRNASALHEAGYQVDVICLREPGQPLVERYWGGIVVRLPLAHRRSGLLRHLWEHSAFCSLLGMVLPALWGARGYSVLEFCTPPDYAVFAAWLPRLLGTRVVLYIFDLLPETLACAYGLRPGSLPLRAAGWLERASAALAQVVIVVDPDAVERVVSRGTPAREVVWLPNVPDDRAFRAPMGDAPAGAEGFLVMTHGSILPRYGVDDLLRAAAELRPLLPELRVWVIGDGEHRRAAQALAARLGLDGTVDFRGWLPYSQVAAAISRAQVGVVPVHFNALPNKLFEYAWMGRAVVAAAQPAIRRVFGEAVLYYPPGDHRALADAILRLYRDEALRRRLGEAARQVALRHSWSRVRQQYVALHEDGPSLLGQAQGAEA